MPLSRLLYVSRCAMRETGAERDALVRDLAERSASRNAAAGLTGSLLHVGDNFVQVLEGPIDAIERTFETICCDFRHDEVKLIDLVPVRERIFPEWSMALLGGGDSTALKLRDDLEDLRFLVGINAREAVSQMRRLLDHEMAVTEQA
ncbi:hypothetical protein HNO88_004125 [Novosphingobium chloroacetimidivorans]|uniref:BLUF domain-containing protein n=1 Tax=Novosphingobium chloroacetimidivorans TaxID=1428314 RepID=A0A7W7NZ11_9SPHN|nr:BLUF domain-containing protein [Novosphingobium chloroacetimidivorans]MBB4860780.1 hypothetical protein [Novosphingobium chloroacetimidivorans]